jgi:hypothetical protein
MLLCIAFAAGAALAADTGSVPTAPFKPTQIDPNPDRKAGLQAFAQIQRVLQHPRCLNCQVPEGPLQGIEKRIHYPPVQRGADGNGVAPMRCSTCHSVHNGALIHSPPGLDRDGNPGWHMPPANMKMNWVGLSTAALCKVVRDPKTNNGKSLAELEQHMATDHLVVWGWTPGPGREAPPLDKASFDEQLRLWIRNGAPCDEKEPLRKSVGATKAESGKHKALQQSDADVKLLDDLLGLQVTASDRSAAGERR